MKYLHVLLVMSIVWITFSCSNPTAVTGGEPKPPKWLDVSYEINSIPAVGKKGNIKFQFVVTGNKDTALEVYSGEDTVNYMRISLKTPYAQNKETIVEGDSTWEGNIVHLDTIKFKTEFTPIKTDYVYFTLNGGYREFDWKVDVYVGFYIEKNGELESYYGNPNPNIRFPGPLYCNLYINTETGDSYLEY